MVLAISHLIIVWLLIWKHCCCCQWLLGQQSEALVVSWVSLHAWSWWSPWWQFGMSNLSGVYSGSNTCYSRYQTFSTRQTLFTHAAHHACLYSLSMATTGDCAFVAPYDLCRNGGTRQPCWTVPVVFTRTVNTNISEYTKQHSFKKT